MSMLANVFSALVGDPNKLYKERLLSSSLPSEITSILPLLRSDLQDKHVDGYLSSIYGLLPEDKRCRNPDKRSYPDVVFYNHYPIGISLCYTPNTKPAGCCGRVHGELCLETVDIFNPDATSRPPPEPTPTRRRNRPPPPTYATPPHLPFTLHLASQSAPLTITTATNGSHFVSYLGEPTRKGGGQGWMGIWVEWRDLKVVDPRVPDCTLELNILVELQDPKGDEWLSEEQMQKGAGGIWDRSAKWKWANIKVFAV